MNRLIIITIIFCIFILGFATGKNFIDKKLQGKYYKVVNENSRLKTDNKDIMQTNEELNFKLGTFERKINN